MATFSTVVRTTNNKYNIVYIRIIHNTKPAYIRTSFRATKKQLRGKNVKDNQILIQTNDLIKEYINKLNLVETTNWDVNKVKEYLLKDSDEISFTDFANEFIAKMSKAGRSNPARNYKISLNSLKKFLKKDNIYFSDLKIETIKDWIESLSHTSRAKNLYPTCIKAIFTAGLEKYNDYNTGELVIRNMPFTKNMIPSADEPIKRFISIRKLKRVLFVDLSDKQADTRPQLAQDVCKMIICLAGINAVDLYVMKKENYVNGKLKYMRHKTKDSRKDKSRFEITVPDEIKYLFEKYKGKDNLFDFSERYTDFNSFSRNVNKGLKYIEKYTGVKTTTYTFRRMWATIAQNNCGASDEEVGFALNHASTHRVTVRYIDKDFSPADELNRKVIDYIKAPTKRKVKRFIRK